MADTYDVVPADIAAELPGLFPGGFGASTVPSHSQVASMITVADLQVSIAVENASGLAPEVSDRLAPLAIQVIKQRVVARVLRIVYAGNAPAEINAAAKPYDDDADAALEAITSLETQATGAGETSNRVGVPSGLPNRDLIVDDDDLDIDASSRRSRF